MECLIQTAGFEAQLKEHGGCCQKIYREQVSPVVERKQLHAATEYVREGDMLVVSKYPSSTGLPGWFPIS